MKKLMFVLSLMIWVNPAHSMIIMSNVTGADMAGIAVTITFDGGGSETVNWVTTSTDPLIANNEGYAGGAFGTGWSLTQQGDTFGDITGTDLLGVWTFTNNSGVPLLSLAIDALMANIVFDNLFTVEGTPGSGPGRPFTPDVTNAPTSAVYSDLFSAPDLYGSLTLDWGQIGLASGSTFRFMADTEMVPEPATLLLFGAGLLGLAGVRAKKRLSTINSEA